jgi:hypothetical protein
MHLVPDVMLEACCGEVGVGCGSSVMADAPLTKREHAAPRRTGTGEL